MLRNNKGSVLVTSLMFFTIIITICISSITISSTNNSYSKLQYQHTKMKELAISGIEVTKSNILDKVKYAIENFDEESSFNEYFLGNIREIIGEVYNSGLDNVRISVPKRATIDSEGNINFVIESLCKDKEYNKRVRANVKIFNPWAKYDITKQDESIDKKTEVNTEFDAQKNIELNENIETTENNMVDIDERELVVIYNYEEN